jgi:hypothetical protein
MEFLIPIYFRIRYLAARHSIVSIYASFCETCEDSLIPLFEYFWYQRFNLKVEYFRLRSIGENVTFAKMEQDYLDQRNKQISEAIDKFNKERDLFYEKNGHWWL